MMKAGMSYRSVARYFNRSHTTIRSLWIKTANTGTVRHGGCGVNRRHTTARADRRLVRMVRGNPMMPATLSRLLWKERSKFGNILTAATVRRRLRESGLRNRRMVRRPRLSPAHVSRREAWAMQRVHWRLRQWKRVIFTDESRFRLFHADGRIHVWREPRQALLQHHVQVSEHQGPSLHVWGGISYEGKTELVFLNTSVTGNVYRNVLQTHLLPFVQEKHGGPSECILQDDNAAPHRAAVVDQWKQHAQLRTLRWPSKSPDMNPIEHVWSHMKRKIRQQSPPPQNLEQLRQEMKNCWDDIPRDYLKRLVLSMPKRVNSLLVSRGGYTRY